MGAQERSSMTHQETAEFVRELRVTFRELELLPMPTVAVVDGALHPRLPPPLVATAMKHRLAFQPGMGPWRLMMPPPAQPSPPFLPRYYPHPQVCARWLPAKEPCFNCHSRSFISSF